MPSVAPTFARVSSIVHWSTFFHPQDGLFRLPRTDGASIEHLDIDLRFIDHEHDNEPDVFRYAQTAQATADVYLPNVAVITLRGAEHVHDHEARMDALAEVLLAIKPIEVRWLNATSDPKEQLTFSTHMVHPAVIAAGDIWARIGGAKRLVLQGGFPCPNLSAPTPYSLTPAATPCSSPGPHNTSFGAAIHSLSTIPSLSLTKSKPVDETKAKERTERKRLAEYSLKPRFDWAVGTWGAEDLEWRFDGRYTPACILASIEHFLNALNKSFPYASTKSDTPLPAMISFAPLPTSIIFSIRELIDKLDLQPELVTYLVDSVFFATTDETCQARLFEGIVPESDVAPRQTNRLKAEMLVLQIQGCSIVPLGQIWAEAPSSPQRSGSMTDSVGSLTQADGFSSGDEGEAVTPDMMASVVMPSENGKAQREMSPTSSVVI